MAEQKKIITPAQRADNFARETRQHLQPLTPKAGAESSIVTFELPKTRMLSKISFMVEASVKVTHSSETTFTPAAYAPYTLLRRVRFEANNGFAPFSLSGKELYMYNHMTMDSNILTISNTSTSRAANVMPLVASSSGATNNIRFTFDLQSTLNDRDPVGLIVLQNPESVAQVEIEVDTASKLFDDTSGYTIELTSMTITPLIESFSIPLNPDSRPDISMLKLVSSTTYTAAGAGEIVCKLQTGILYRKLMFSVEDSSGGVADSFITSDIELVFNQADIPYRISPKHLSTLNHKQFKNPLPKGLFALDLTAFQGLPNYSGSRDYIDTSRLTEMWLRFTVSNAATVRVIHEQLSKLTAR